jgi:hypothetical protein
MFVCLEVSRGLKRCRYGATGGARSRSRGHQCAHRREDLNVKGSPIVEEPTVTLAATYISFRILANGINLESRIGKGLGTLKSGKGYVIYLIIDVVVRKLVCYLCHIV